MALTPKRRRFVEEYLIDLNAAAAYRRAGYRVRNDNVAAVEGHRLLSNPNIAAAVAAAQQSRAERVGLAADEVLAELKLVGRSSVWDYRIDDRGNVTLAPGAPAAAIRAVASIKRKVRHLGEVVNQITVDEDTAHWARVALDRMLALA